MFAILCNPGKCTFMLSERITLTIVIKHTGASAISCGLLQMKKEQGQSRCKRTECLQGSEELHVQGCAEWIPFCSGGGPLLLRLDEKNKNPEGVVAICDLKDPTLSINMTILLFVEWGNRIFFTIEVFVGGREYKFVCFLSLL